MSYYRCRVCKEFIYSDEDLKDFKHSRTCKGTLMYIKKPPISKPKRGLDESYYCDHNYRVVHHDLNVTEYKFDDSYDVFVNGVVIFHCTKCLDIQKVEIE